jgi:hypothetical protein
VYALGPVSKERVMTEKVETRGKMPPFLVV